ncbi:MAG: DMT family transporter [Bacteroidales bacterium]|nr:DMT family transporter [Bacteroidales bacterium]
MNFPLLSQLKIKYVKNHALKPHLLILLAMLFWGISYIWSKEVFNYLEPATTVWFRLIISVLFFSGYFRWKRQKISIKKEHWGLLIVASFFNPFLYFVGESYGLQRVSPTISAVIISTIPLFTPVFAFLFLKERLKPLNILGLFISFAGILIMIIDRTLGFTASPVGIAFLFLAVFSAIVYGIILKKLTYSYDAVTIVFIQNIMGIIFFAPVVFGIEHEGLSAIEWRASWLISLLLLGVFASSLAFVFFTHGVHKLGITKSTIYTNIIPVFTSFFSFLIIGESITFDKLVGIACVIIGVLLSQMKKSTEKIRTV